MIIVLKPEATDETAKEIMRHIEDQGLKPLCMPGKERVVLGALGDERILGKLHLESHPLVEAVHPVLAPYKLVSREMKSEDTVVSIDDVPLGEGYFTVVAGPCAVETREQLEQTGKAVKRAGAACLRGGAFKPRTSPYSFQGLGLEGLKILSSVAADLGMPAVTEVVEVSDVAAVEVSASAFQVGARNMQNFRLLEQLGKTRKPVLLKRGMAAKVDDLLLAAEYIVSKGNPNVILCERGIKTFETVTRNTLDMAAIPFIKQRSHLPIIVDPSHGTGVRDLVAPMAKAALAAGADGLLIEVHCDPTRALSDGFQSLYPDQFTALMEDLRGLAATLGKEMVGG